MTQEIYVFESNLKGLPITSSALLATKYYGAIPGQARGRVGNSYALPTRDHYLRILPFEDIKKNVEIFLKFVGWKSLTDDSCTFIVASIGLGLVDYRSKDVAELFRGVLGLSNITLSDDYIRILMGNKCTNPTCITPATTRKFGKLCQKCFDRVKKYGDYRQRIRGRLVE